MRSSGGFKSALARASFPNPRHDSHRKASCDGARGTINEVAQGCRSLRHNIVRPVNELDDLDEIASVLKDVGLRDVRIEHGVERELLHSVHCLELERRLVRERDGREAVLLNLIPDVFVPLAACTQRRRDKRPTRTRRLRCGDRMRCVQS